MAEINDRPSTLGRHLIKGLMPAVPYYHCRRPVLSDKFRRALASKVAWVCAPAGFGKTTFLCSYFSEKRHPVVWVSLDDHDNDLYAFWRSVIASLRRLVPGLAESAFEALCEDAPDIYGVLSAVLDEITLKAPDVFIVLDDYHCVDSTETRDSLLSFMRYLPASAHLIVSSRNEPPPQLNILKGHGDLSEINAGDLRLSLQEACDMLHEFSDTPIPPEMVKTLYELTDGWVTSFKMAMIAMQGTGDIESLMVHLQKQAVDAMSCLVDEMLGHQEPEIRDFLLVSSIPDRFTADLCDFILEESDCDRKIDVVLFRNLFLQPTDDGEWYQYHSLFRRELLRRAREEYGDTITKYYRKICKWLEIKGRLEESLDYALDGKEPKRAIDILDRISMERLGKDNYGQFWAWLNRIPEDIVRSSFYTNVSCVTYYEMVRKPEIQREHIRRALSLCSEVSSDPIDDATHGTNIAPLIAVLVTLQLYHANQFDEAIAHGETCLRSLPKDAAGHCSVLTVKGMCHWRIGDLASAQSCCSTAARFADEAQWPYSACLNLSATANIRYQQLHLDSAKATCREIDTLNARMKRDVSSSGYSQMVRARIFYHENALDESAAYIEKALAIAEQYGEPALWFSAQMALARLQLAQGEVTKAKAIASSAKIRADGEVSDSRLAGMSMARFWLLTGNVSMAADYLEKWFGPNALEALSAESIESVVRDHVFNDIRECWAETPLMVYVRVKLAEGQTHGLAEILGKVHKQLDGSHWKVLLLETIVLEALVLEKTGDLDGALAFLEDALAMTDGERLPRLFADEGKGMQRLCLKAIERGIQPSYANEILELLGPARQELPSWTTALGPERTLSEREVAILELLCQGATNQTIADVLFLGLSTVKNHLYSIYRKLGTTNRAQTILAVQELGILSRHGER
ncbi:MAG: LuxR C-terminal-related transcriptional regulator [Coriobacteriia bacterium]